MKKVMTSKLRTWLFLGVSAILISGMSSCKKDKDDPTPTPGDLENKVTYTISGKVTDDENTTLKDVKIELTGKQTKSTSSDAQGAFKFDLGDNSANATGEYKLSFQLEGHKSVSASINVKEIKNGSADYDVNAMMVKASVAPVIEYKTPVYALKVEIKDVTADDLKVVVKDPEGEEVSHEAGASFTLTDLQPGLYSITASATGYTEISGEILVNEVQKQVKQEGDEDTFTVTTAASYKMTAVEPEEPEAPASYSISGKIQDTEGIPVTAKISLSSTSTDFPEKIWNASEYTVAVPENAVKDVFFTLHVSAEGYYDYSTLFSLKTIEAGQTLNQIINVVMSKKPDENEIKYVTVKATATNFAEQAKEIGLTLDNSTGTQVAKITAPEKIVIEPIVATVTKANGNKEEIADKISFDAAESATPLVITYPKGNTNNALTFTRNVAEENQLNETTEKPGSTNDLVTTAVVARIYEGGPDGTSFSQPVKFTFTAPYTITTPGNGVKMNLLYKNEETGEWEADGDNYVELNDEGEYVAKVHHFSSFAPGFESSIAKSDDTTSTETSDKYQGQSFKQGNLKMTAMVEMGMIYAGKTATEAVAEHLSGKDKAAQEYIVELLETKIKADNAGLCPTAKEFGPKQAKVLSFTVDKQYSIDHLELSTTYTQKAYTIKVEGNDITVTVKTARTHSVSVAYTQEHAGHGSDINAGGGIVDFE